MVLHNQLEVRWLNWKIRYSMLFCRMPESASPVLHLTEATFESQVFQSDKLVLVNFWANWCPPCKILGPILEEIAKEKSHLVLIAKVDIEAEPALYQRYGVHSLPTLFFYKDGELIEKIVGAPPKRALVEKIHSLAGDLV